MATTIAVTKTAIYDAQGSKFTVTTESIKVLVNNISSLEPDGSGTQIMLVNIQELDGAKVYGYGVSESISSVQTLIDTVTTVAGAGTFSSLSVTGQVVTGKQVVNNHTNYTAATDTTAGWTLTEVKTGLGAGVLKTTSAAAVTLTLDSVANIITYFGTLGVTLTTGSDFMFYVDNSQGANTVTVAVDGGATIAVATSPITGGSTLTVSTANKLGLFNLYITSTTTAILSRVV